MRLIVKTYWRDNRDPFPGRLVEVKRVRMSRSERAWLDFVRRCQKARDERERAACERDADAFEALADRACQGGLGDEG